MPPETIQEAGASLAGNAERIQEWVKGPNPAPVATDAPAPAPVPDPAPAATPAPEGEQPRDPVTGKFLPKDKADEGAPPPSATHATDGASAAPAAPPAPPPPGASAQAVIDYLEAQHGDQPFKIPRDVRIPLKRGDQVEYATVEELQKRGMLELDYRHKTAEVARQRREYEDRQTKLAAEQARFQAREQWLKEREAEMIEAQKDPEKWDAYLELQRQYQTNPHFRKVMDDALAKRESDAELAVYQEERYSTEVNRGVELAASWIEEMGRDPQFAGVNAERVRVRYAQALVAGQASLDPAEVRALFAEEARYLAESQSPLQTKLAELQAQVDALKGSKAAETHNAKTAHALDRAKTPPVAASGRPPAPAAAPAKGRFGPNDLPERNAAWAAER